MFDLTKNVFLEPLWLKYYRRSRAVLVAIFFFLSLYLAYLILFPITRLTYSFADPRQQDPLLANLQGGGAPAPADGNIQAASPLTFQAFDSELHSKINLTFALDSGSLSGSEVKLQKGYQAYAYPVASTPASFPDGTLLKNKEDFYIISEGKIRRFKNAETVKTMGYDENVFLNASPEELGLHPSGASISEPENYPDSTFFFIDQNYYELKGGRLHPFLSPRAFASRFPLGQAIGKDSAFLERFPLAEEKVGFANGSLLSFADAVYIVNDGEMMPFSNPVVFLSFGFSWEDVTPASEDEISSYPRGSFFSMFKPHPDGTVFQEKETGRYYLIEKQVKKEILGGAVLRSFSNRRYILASRQSLDITDSCLLEKTSWIWKEYGCSISDERLRAIPGNGYFVSFPHQSPLDLKELEVVFSEHINLYNLSRSLSRMINLFLSHYGYATRTQ